MDTPLLKTQREFYILPTKKILGDRATISPDDAANIFFLGLSMDQFLIAGSWSIEILSALKGKFNSVYCFCLSPIALYIVKIYDRRVQRIMK